MPPRAPRLPLHAGTISILIPMAALAIAAPGCVGTLDATGCGACGTDEVCNTATGLCEGAIRIDSGTPDGRPLDTSSCLLPGDAYVPPF